MISINNKNIFKVDFIKWLMKRGYMTENKKGLSAIIATLLIILLTLVSVGIIWAVIRNVVQSGADQLESSQKCISVALEAVNVTETSVNSGIYAVTLSRGADNQGDLGVKVNIFNTVASTSSGVSNVGAVGDLDSLGRQTFNVNTNNPPLAFVSGGNKMEFTVFFIDGSGNEQVCQSTNDFNF